MPNLIRNFGWIFWLVSICELAFSQVAPLPLVKNFRPSEYQAGRSNWAIVQDKRGIIYIGNASSILEYDGTTWRKIYMPNNSYVRSMDIDDSGRIWVGGLGDFGFLQADSYGKKQFVSLKGSLDEKYHDFKNVWNTFCTKDGIYFQSFERLIRYNEDSGFKIWEPNSSFHFSFSLNDRFFIREWGLGLLEMVDDSLVLLPGGSIFANERIYVMLPYDHHRILVGSRSQGLFLYDNVSFSEFPTEVDDLLKSAQLYHPGIIISDSLIGLGTLNEGLIIIDKKGSLVQKIDKSSGLTDNTITYIFKDRKDILWVARDNGISRIEINSPFTYFDERLGLEGRVETIIHHDNKVYIGSSSGVYVLEKNSFNVRKVNGINAQVWEFLDVGDQLLCASSDGLFEINGHQASIIRKSITQDFYVNDLLQSRKNPDLLFAGLSTGLSILKKRNGKWKEELKYPKIDAWVNQIVQTSEGDIWLSTTSDGVFRLEMPNERNKGEIESIKISQFKMDQGLPDGVCYVFEINDVVYVSVVGNNVFRFDSSKNYFYRDHIFKEISNETNDQFFNFNQDTNGRIWVTGGLGSYVGFFEKNDSLTFNRTFLNRFSNIYAIEFVIESDGYLSLITEEGAININAEYLNKEVFTKEKALIRKVSIGNDSIIYWGENPVNIEQSSSVPFLDYSLNAILFEFALPSFSIEEETQFQTLLEGFDNDWSSFSKNYFKEYLNLHEGKYRFKVRAKNVDGQLSNEAVFEFKVLPPWYRSIWSYLFYVLIFGLFIFILTRTQRAYLIKKERKLAEIRESKLRAQVIKVEKERMESELNIAKDIQMGMLPLTFPAFPKRSDIDIFAALIPAREVGGDFYDFFFIDENHLCFVVGDVSGKGVPAALMMAVCKTLIKSQAGNEKSTASILTQVNNVMAKENVNSMFVTVFIGVLNASTGEMTYTNAGHNPTYIKRVDGSVDKLSDLHGLVIAAMEDIHYKESNVKLNQGDAIFVYTDGIPEAHDAKGEMYGDKKLYDMLLKHNFISPKQITKEIIASVADFEKGAEQFDDVTALCIQFYGK